MRSHCEILRNMPESDIEDYARVAREGTYAV